MNKDIQDIINGDIDLYEFFDLSIDSSSNEIRKKYRQKALIYHPDKNSGCETQFNLLSKAYEILSTPSLKESYDNIWNLKKNNRVRDEKLDELTRNFKIELEKAERDHSLKHNLNDQSEDAVKRRRRNFNLEQLKEEGLLKRQEYESLLLKKNTKSEDIKDIITFSDIPFNKILSLTEKKSNRVIVKWKHKPELKDLFTSDILHEIMQIFGEVVYCKVSPKKTASRYDEGIVEFKNIINAEKASHHNYKGSAKLWDGTKVRKLASLLRECKFENTELGMVVDIDKQQNDIEYFKKLGKIPKDYKILNNGPGIILNKLVLKQLQDSSNSYSI